MRVSPNIKNVLIHLPNYPGVYQMLGEKGEILYVGKAKNLRKRLSSYYSKKKHDPKTALLIKQVKDIDITTTPSENEAVLLECNLIKKHHPRYNVLLRDDKSYPYILITQQHVFPRIDIYRGQRKKYDLYFGPYPSSFAVREAISLLQKLFRMRTCSDHYFETRLRPCLLYQIKRCTGPCVGLISEQAYARNLQHAILFLQGKSDQLIECLQQQMEAAAETLNYELAQERRDQIARLRQMQEQQYVSMAAGNADVIGFAMEAGVICFQLLSIRSGQVIDTRSYFPHVPIHSRLEEVISAFLTQHYLYDVSHVERIPKEVIMAVMIPEQELLSHVLSQQANRQVTIFCPQRGEKKKWLMMAMNRAKQSLTAHLFQQTNVRERLLALQKELALQTLPQRIECFDVSHSMGEATVASCVVFNQEGPIKSDYRRFNITDITPGDDVAAMRQVLLRRFKRLQREHAVLPDVVLIDGGKAQLVAAKAVMAELNIVDILLVGVAKGAGRKPGFETLHFLHRPPTHLARDSLALHFIQQIRDEAHRFAITGHRQRRDKSRHQSVLERIPGIGAKRRRQLLRYFGGIQGIAHASLNELMKVPGINHSLAERVFAILHDTTI